MIHIAIDTDLKVKSDHQTKEVRGKTILHPHVENQLLQLIEYAYNMHLIPVITPDDIYLQILAIIAKHVNKSPAMVDYYRPYLADRADPNNKTVINIVRDYFDLNDIEMLKGVFDELMERIAEKSASSEILQRLASDFTTTTPIQRLTSQVSLAYMVKEFFAMQITMMCGWRGIDLEGTQADWESVASKLNIFAKIAHPDFQSYLAGCQKSLQIIIRAFQGDVNVDEWRKIFSSRSCGSGSIEYDGWFLNFFGAHEKQNWTPDDETTSRVQYDFGISDGSGDRNVTIDIGAIGVEYQNGRTRLCYDYFIEPAKAKGFTLLGPDGARKVNFLSEFDFSHGPEYYSRVRFEDQPLHFYIRNARRYGIIYDKKLNRLWMVSGQDRNPQGELIEDFINSEVVDANIWSRKFPEYIKENGEIAYEEYDVDRLRVGKVMNSAWKESEISEDRWAILYKYDRD